MRKYDEKTYRYIGGFVWLGIALCCLAALLRFREEASAEDSLFSLSRATPTPTPTPLRTPQPVRPRRTPTPQPLPIIQPSDRIWVVQGDVFQARESFVCRAECKRNWADHTFEILQVTRGTEDWRRQLGEVVGCTRADHDAEKKYLSGGSWQTPPTNPEESLCFLVVRQITGQRQSDTL